MEQATERETIMLYKTWRITIWQAIGRLWNWQAMKDDTNVISITIEACWTTSIINIL